VEASLPPLRHQPADRDPALGVRALVIAWQLNVRQVNRKRGRDFLIRRMR
jgi:hypothetical protein